MINAQLGVKVLALMGITIGIYIFCDNFPAYFSIPKSDDGNNQISTLKSDHFKEKVSSQNESLPKVVDALQACVSTSVRNLLTINGSSMADAINSCVNLYLNIPEQSLLKLRMGRFDERKVFLNYNLTSSKGQAASQGCSFLTVGIGGDIEVEKQLKTLYPNCFIVGVDPEAQQAVGFSEIGTYINAGLGEVSGTEMLTVRVDGAYVERNSTVISPKDFMARISNRTKSQTNFHFHFATIDIEGFEYTLLKQAGPTGWQRAGLKLCQLDLELHYVAQHADIMGDWMERFLEDTGFAPIASSAFIAVKHCKVSLINPTQYCDDIFDFKHFVRPR